MLTFTARRSKPELVAPPRATPCETKALSDIDNQQDLRYYLTFVEFFRRRPRPPVGDGHPLPDDDPAKVVREALAEALVYYYPVAGRLREATGGKLVVECTGEGVVFVEADADVRLEQFGEPLLPPWPCVEELLCDAGDMRVVVGKPLLFMQVTRLKCGGFVIGLHMCHTIADGFGLSQFIKAVADMARGEALPTVLPVWERELLMARTLQPIMHEHLAYEPLTLDASCEVKDMMQLTPLEDMIGQYFLFGPREIAALRSHVPPHLRQSTTAFELVTAVMWRCRTVALGYAPEQHVRVIFTVNSRGKWKHDPPIPQGYYGNAFIFQAAETTVRKLSSNHLGHEIELMRAAKFTMTDEHMKSAVDILARHGMPPFMAERTYVVLNIVRLWDNTLDFGCGERVGGGIPMAGDMIKSKLPSIHMGCRNGDGEECVAVSMCLPRMVMERFAAQIAVWSTKQGQDIIPSSL